MTTHHEKTETVHFDVDGRKYRIKAIYRFDDRCNNGHKTFSLTGQIDRKLANGRWVDEMGGCIHDEIKRHFPHLEPFIKWHLTSTDGPLHYLSNTLYQAGERDCWGRLKGEPYRYQTVLSFGDNPIKHRSLPPKFVSYLHRLDSYDLEVVALDHPKERETFGTRYTLSGYGERWHECHFKNEQDAFDFLEALQKCNPVFTSEPTAWGEGKEPDLEAARASAVWPDATLEQLRDKEALKARLPGLMKEFRAAMEQLGFDYDAA